MSDVNLSVKIGSLELKNPVMLASGTVGYGEEISRIVDLTQVGAIITKSISLEPRKGNPPERIWETSSGMLNAIGLANIGLKRFVDEKIPFLEKINTTVICNIAASSFGEYAECVKSLKDIETIKAFEINVSCPNVKDGGLLFGNDINAVREITSLLRPITDKPLIIKLSPNTASIKDFAQAVKEEGADAVSAINTLVGTAFNIYTRKPRIKNITGGLSGPAIKPVALAKVLEISRDVDIPVIGVGGISSWEDAAEFIIAGASAVQIGTANFVNPKISEEVIEGLRNYCTAMNISDINDLVASYTL